MRYKLQRGWIKSDQSDRQKFDEEQNLNLLGRELLNQFLDGGEAHIKYAGISERVIDYLGENVVVCEATVYINLK